MEKSRGVDILIAFDVTGSCACILQ